VRIWLAALLALGLAGCDGCTADRSPPPIPVEHKPTTRTVEGAGWSAEIPADWETREPGLFVGPDRANLLVVTKEVPLPVGLLTDSIKQDLLRKHPDMTFDVERGLKLHGLSVYELRGRYTSRGGRRVVQHQLIGEGGKTKYIATLSVLQDFYPDHAADFNRITASFRGEFRPLSPPPTPPAP
jgi:hypothetical protein